MRRFLEGGAYSSKYGIWSEGLKFKPIGRANKDHRLSHNIVIWGVSRHYSSGYCYSSWGYVWFPRKSKVCLRYLTWKGGIGVTQKEGR